MAGWGSGAGKSAISEVLLSFLLSSGFDASEISYIKPVTQCENLGRIASFCALHNVAAVPIGPVVFRPGVTNDAIGDSNFIEVRHAFLRDAVSAVADIAIEKKFVIVDGVGYPTVGSCVGVGNGDLANAIEAKVLLVAPNGLGDAIDTFELMHAYFQVKKCEIIGVIFNRRKDTSRHRRDETDPLVEKYMNELHPHMFVGFLPEFDNREDWVDSAKSLLNLQALFERAALS